MSPKKNLRQPGVEPGSAAWKATMITATPLTLNIEIEFYFAIKELYIFMCAQQNEQSYMICIYRKIFNILLERFIKIKIFYCLIMYPR
jgi:hypothetical protein